MLGLLFWVLYIVICDTIRSPSCTVRCPGATESFVLLSSAFFLFLFSFFYIYIFFYFLCFSVIDTGEVLWLPGGVYKTSCDIDITYYPFDTQICTIIFSTLVSTLGEINLDADSLYSTHLDLYSESGTWKLISFTTAKAVDTR